MTIFGGRLFICLEPSLAASRMSMDVLGNHRNVSGREALLLLNELPL